MPAPYIAERLEESVIRLMKGYQLLDSPNNQSNAMQRELTRFVKREAWLAVRISIKHWLKSLRMKVPRKEKR